MSAKRKRIEKDQQTSDNDDKDQQVIVNLLPKIFMPLSIPERIDFEEVFTKWKDVYQQAWCDITKYKCESSIGRSYDNRLLTQSYLEKILLRCGIYLKELSLSYICNSSIMPFLGDHCKNLTSLECTFDVKSLIHNTDDFVQAFTQLDKLKCIKISVNHHRDYYDETISLVEMIDSLPEEINEIHILYRCRWGNIRSALFILKKFKKLQKLTLHGLGLDNLILQEIGEKTTLVHLDIELYDERIGFPLFDKLINLQYIKIKIEDRSDEDTEKLSKILLNTIFRTCKNLKHLDIPHSHFDVAEIPLKRWINFQNLEYLCLPCDELSPHLADTIVKYCKNLKYLSITYTYKRGLLNEYAVKKLTELENLESLLIKSILFQLSEKAIIAISNNCRKLKRLDLVYCTIVPTGIDDGDLSSPSVLDELSKLQYLEHLNLRNSKNLKDSTIIAIANNCKNLKSLDIHDTSPCITETALIALTNLKNLEKLNVGNHLISDSFIIRLRGLKQLDCSYCDKLTNAGIIQFIKNNPDLSMIDVSDINNITIDLIIGADQATKNRTNGIILYITTNDMSIIDASKPIIKSQWLAVFVNYF